MLMRPGSFGNTLQAMAFRGTRQGKIIHAAALAVCLASLSLGSSAYAAFPGANGKIAYDSSPMTDGEIVTINPDGTAPSTITSNGVDDFEPAWSPNGQRIVFVRRDATSQRGEIWVMNADGSGQTQLTDDTADGASDEAPAFSGDGSRIVFARQTGGSNSNDIFVMNANGTGQTDLTPVPAFDTEPTFSPDSQRIAFVREVSGASNPDAIFVMNADGSGQTNVTPIDNTMDAAGPNFSPDGAQLTFSRCVLGISEESCPTSPEIVRMPAGGGAITEVTSNGGGDNEPSDIDPAFSPDGAQIAFNRQAAFTSASDILRVAAGGGAGTPVTTTGDERNPDWQPVAATPPSGGTGSGGALGAFGGPRARCFNEDVTIFGTNASEKIVGTPGNDVIRGFRGEDKINGKGGEDILCGGRGEDRIFGKKANDILIGGDGSDYLNGGPGINRLFGGTPGAKDEKALNVCVVGGSDTEQNCQVVK